MLANNRALLSEGDLRAVFFGRDLSYLLFAAYVALIVLLVRLLDRFIFDFLVSRRRRGATPILLREILTITLYLLLFAAAISSVFNKSLAGLLTSATVLAAIIGLAMQDTLGNLFSGISLHMEEAFEVGDVIHSGDFIGVVEGVNWRATRIRAFNDQVVVLPNSVLARERLEVFPHDHLSARLVPVGIGYHVPPVRAIAVLEQAVRNLENVSQRVPPIARIAAFAESSITYEVKYWTDKYHLREIIDAEIRKAIWYALKRNDIPIPFPIRTLVNYTEPQHVAVVPREDVLERLQKVELLGALSRAEHESIAEGTRVHAWANGETILRFGDEGHSMFVLHSGSVAIRVPDDQMQFSEVARLGEGSVFGEMALLTGENRTADVVALADSIVLEIDKQCLQPVLTHHPALASALTETIMQRRDHLEQSRAALAEDETSILRRIRSYFGL